MICRYHRKRTYPTRKAARQGAEDIKTIVGHNGGTYTQLYPYRCPDMEHWHLSHYPQGYRKCGTCGDRAPAWNGGKIWVTGAHLNATGEPCTGEGNEACTGS